MYGPNMSHKVSTVSKASTALTALVISLLIVYGCDVFSQCKRARKHFVTMWAGSSVSSISVHVAKMLCHVCVKHRFPTSRLRTHKILLEAVKLSLLNVVAG